MKRNTRSKRKTPSPPAPTEGRKRRAAPSPSVSPTLSPPTKTSKRQQAATNPLPKAETNSMGTRSNRNSSSVTPTPAINTKNKKSSPAAAKNKKQNQVAETAAAAKDKNKNKLSPVIAAAAGKDNNKASPVMEAATAKANNKSSPPSAKSSPSATTSPALSRRSNRNATSTASPAVSPVTTRKGGRNSRQNTPVASKAAGSSASAKSPTAAGQKRGRPASSGEESPSQLEEDETVAKPTKQRKPRKKRKRLQARAGEGQQGSDQQQSSDDSTSLAEDSKSVIDNSLTPTEDMKPLVEDNKPQLENIKPLVEDSKLLEEDTAASTNPRVAKRRGRRGAAAQQLDATPVTTPVETSPSSNTTHTNGRQPTDCHGITSTNLDDVKTELDKVEPIKKMTRSREQSSIKESVRDGRSISTKRRLSNGSASENDSPVRNKAKKRHVNGVGMAEKTIKADSSECGSELEHVPNDDVAEEKPIINGSESMKNSALNGESETRSHSCDTGVISCSNDILDSSDSKSSTAKQQQEGSQKVADVPVAAAAPEPVDADMLSDTELLLKGFGLADQQVHEVFHLLPVAVQGETTLTASTVSQLVWCLLRQAAPNPLKTVSSPRCNKLIRQLLDHYCGLSEPLVTEKHALCQECVSWARSHRRTALCQELEVSLMTLFASTGHWRQAEQTASALYAATKNMQDKEKTVKACLCLSQSFHAMSNLSKARGFITTAKTEALKIYTPPELQAQLDLQSGILQVAEGKDMETAVSYFKEAASGSPCQQQRSRALKYLVLGCLLLDRPSDGHKAASSTTHLADVDQGVVAMLAVADSAATASVHKFRKAREQYASELEEDAVVGPVLDKLYTDLMEKNIRSVLLPYQRVQIQHVADQLSLAREEVERRLSQMILDGSLSGQLDHRDHCLYLYPREDSDSVYDAAIDTIACLEKTIVHLSRRAKKLLL